MGAHEVCFNCGYLLTGHAGTFVCPECGVAYDEHTKVWYVPHTLGGRGYRQRETLIATGLLALCALFLIGYFRYGAAALNVLVSIGMLVFVLGVCKSVLYRRYVRAPFVAVTPSGVLVNHSGRERDAVSLAWTEIGPIIGKARSRFTAAEEVALELGVPLPSEEARQLLAALSSRMKQGEGEKVSGCLGEKVSG